MNCAYFSIKSSFVSCRTMLYTTVILSVGPPSLKKAVSQEGEACRIGDVNAQLLFELLGDVECHVKVTAAQITIIQSAAAQLVDAGARYV